jgi:hypothetical protein
MQQAVVFVFLLFTLGACKKENAPAPFTCNSAVTYTTVAKAIIDTRCAYSGCHAATTPQGGIALATYIDCKALAQTGILMCTIKHDSCAYKPMPYPVGAPKLSDSLITILDCWVTKGTPE